MSDLSSRQDLSCGSDGDSRVGESAFAASVILVPGGGSEVGVFVFSLSTSVTLNLCTWGSGSSLPSM